MPNEKQEAFARIALQGAPDPRHHSTNEAVLDYICRATMRHPNAEASKLIAEVKASLHSFFSQLSDEQITWILSNATESRGHFNTIKALRDFCSGALSTHSTCAVAAIDGIISAINYSCRPSAAKEAQNPSALQAVRELAAGAPTYIGATYPERGQDMASGRMARDTLAPPPAKLIAIKREISLASEFSEFEGFVNHPQVPPKRQVFEEQGYPKLAAQSGVPLVGHVSGTMPGNLTVINNLLFKHRNRSLDEDEAYFISGLISASFHRSAFHSPPEVLMGLRHFQGQTVTKEAVPQDIVSMKQLFRDSVELMADCTDTQLRNDVMLVLDDLELNPALTMQEASAQLANLKFTHVDEPCSEHIDFAEIDLLDAQRGSEDHKPISKKNNNFFGISVLTELGPFLSKNKKNPSVPEVARGLHQMFEAGKQGNTRYTPERCKLVAQAYINISQHKAHSKKEIKDFIKEVDQYLRTPHEAQVPPSESPF